MSTLNIRKTVLAGLAGTSAMTAVMLLAPLMAIPRMNIGEMLGSVMGGSVVVGWGAHFVIGTVLAAVYGALFVHRLPGPAPVRGMTFALLPWLMAQLVVMPMMGMGLFSGSARLALGSLLGHLVYGAVVGLVYGASEEFAASGQTHRHAHA